LATLKASQPPPSRILVFLPVVLFYAVLRNYQTPKNRNRVAQTLQQLRPTVREFCRTRTCLFGLWSFFLDRCWRGHVVGKKEEIDIVHVQRSGAWIAVVRRFHHWDMSTESRSVLLLVGVLEKTQRIGVLIFVPLPGIKLFVVVVSPIFVDLSSIGSAWLFATVPRLLSHVHRRKSTGMSSSSKLLWSSSRGIGVAVPGCLVQNVRVCDGRSVDFPPRVGSLNNQSIRGRQSAARSLPWRYMLTSCQCIYAWRAGIRKNPWCAACNTRPLFSFIVGCLS